MRQVVSGGKRETYYVLRVSLHFWPTTVPRQFACSMCGARECACDACRGCLSGTCLGCAWARAVLVHELVVCVGVNVRADHRHIHLASSCCSCGKTDLFSSITCTTTNWSAPWAWRSGSFCSCMRVVCFFVIMCCLVCVWWRNEVRRTTGTVRVCVQPRVRACAGFGVSSEISVWNFLHSFCLLHTNQFALAPPK